MLDFTKTAVGFDKIGADNSGAQYVYVRFSDGTGIKDLVAYRAIVMSFPEGDLAGGWWVCNDFNDGMPAYRFESLAVANQFADVCRDAWARLTSKAV
jgi:hypothetical protein